MRLFTFCIVGGLAGFGLARWTAAPAAIRAVESGRAENKALTQETSAKATPSVPDSTKPVPEQLKDALRGGDPFAASQRMVDWINASTREDFAEFARDPGKIPMPFFHGLGNEFERAYFDALVDRWFALDPDGAIRGIKSMNESPKSGPNGPPLQCFSFLAAAARSRPEAFLDGMIDDFEKGKTDGVIDMAFENLSTRDPKAARRFLDRLPTLEAKRSAEVRIANGIAQSDPLAAVAIAKQMKEKSLYGEALAAAERIGPGMVSQVASAIGYDQIQSWDLAKLALRNPGIIDATSKPVEELSGELIANQLIPETDRLSPEERQAALGRLGDFPSGTRDALAAAIASSWARTEPKEAAEWAMAHAKPADRAGSANEAAQGVFLRWINGEPEAAVAWWRSLPDSKLRDALGTNASTFLAEQGDLETALTLYRPQPGKEDDQATAQLVQMFAKQDPAKAAEWLRKIPDGVSGKRGSRTVVDAWYSRDPEAVAHWVESLPAGPRRDEATQAFVKQASVESPSGATEWVETINDPKLRQEAAEHVFWQMRSEDPAAASKWIKGLKGVDAEWHARFLKANP